MRVARPFRSDHLGRTLVAWCDLKCIVSKTPESHDGLDDDRATVCSEGKVALQSDHRPHENLDNGRTTV